MRSIEVRLTVFVLLCLTFLACGGGGGGGGGGGLSVNLQPASATVGRNGQVNFTATVSNASNPDVTWSASTGSITPTGVGTATYTAPNAAATATVTATSVEDNTKSDSSTVTVVVGVATVTGKVVRSGSSLGLANVIIEFRDAGGATVATVTTNGSGNFSAGVPTTATRFHVRNSTVPSGYYKQYTYDGLRYTTLETTCSAPLPSLSEGTSTALASEIAFSPTSNPPPPPPNGCT